MENGLSRQATARASETGTVIVAIFAREKISQLHRLIKFSVQSNMQMYEMRILDTEALLIVNWRILFDWLRLLTMLLLA